MIGTAGQSRVAIENSHCRGGRLSLLTRAFYLFCILAFSACETAEQEHSYGVTAGQFQDVVVPTGFQLRDKANESYSREEAGWRQAHLVYFGPAGLDEATNYVLQRMPQHSWVFVAEEPTEDAGRRVRFTRGSYSASYTFERREGATQIVVDYATDYARR